VNAEPAVLERFLFSRKALDPASGCRQDAIIVISHCEITSRDPYGRDENKKEIFPETSEMHVVALISSTILKTIQHQK
jgi:hypothetical protein